MGSLVEGVAPPVVGRPLTCVTAHTHAYSGVNRCPGDSGGTYGTPDYTLPVCIEPSTEKNSSSLADKTILYPYSVGLTIPSDHRLHDRVSRTLPKDFLLQTCELGRTMGRVPSTSREPSTSLFPSLLVPNRLTGHRLFPGPPSPLDPYHLVPHYNSDW